MRLFEDHSIFSPGRVMWDHLYDLRPDLMLYEQDALVGCEDVLAIEYPNDVLFDVSYLGRSERDARFVVAVVPPNADSEWQPAVERVCRTFAELKAAVIELAPVARDWKR